MAKGEGTRSGLLWEVERLLNECTELPQILLMENVTQVHGKKNIEHFDEWIAFLESKGYSNYWKDLNSKNFGIPQNRNRTFMISVLGNYTYEFPQEFLLELRLKDMLEKEVDEKYCLSDKGIEYVIKREGKYTQNTMPQQAVVEPMVWDGYNQRIRAEQGVVGTLTTNCGADLKRNGQGIIEPQINVVGNYSPSGHDASRIVDANGLAPTVKENHGTVTAVLEPQVIGGIGEKKSNGGTQWYLQDRIYDNNIATSVTTAFNPYYKHNLRIRKLTPKECYRLMGFDDADYEKAAQVNSASQLYKQAGNSIVVDVLEHIFLQMGIQKSWEKAFAENFSMRGW